MEMREARRANIQNRAEGASTEKQRRRDKETCDFCRISAGTSTLCFSALAAEACLKEYIWIADKLPGWMKAVPHTLAFT